MRTNGLLRQAGAGLFLTMALAAAPGAAAASQSVYAQLGDDATVSASRTLLSRQVALAAPADLLVSTDGRYGPAGDAAANVYVSVDGRRASKESFIDWRGGANDQQHSFNAVGAVRLAAGTHTVSLIAEAVAGSYYVGAGSNLAALVRPIGTVREEVLRDDAGPFEFNTSNLQAGMSPPTASLASAAVQPGGGDVVALGSGWSYWHAHDGDAMWGISLDGHNQGNDASLWTVQDICRCAETHAPMYTHAFFGGLAGAHRISLDASEFPFRLPGQGEDPASYRVRAGARLVVIDGPLTVRGAAPSSDRVNDWWDYQVAGGRLTGPSLSSNTPIATATIDVPNWHDGVVMLAAKTRVQGDPEDPGGTAALWLEIDGKRVGSTGVQQLAAPDSASQRTITASYLAAGDEALRPGRHTVTAYGRADGNFKHLAMVKDLTLLWFDSGPRAPGPGGPGPGAGLLSMTDVSLSHRRFRVGRKPTAVSARRAPSGTTVRFTLSEVATTRIAIKRRLRGRRVGRRCLRPTRRLRGRRRCVRLVTRGTLTRRSTQGSTAFRSAVGSDDAPSSPARTSPSCARRMPRDGAHRRGRSGSGSCAAEALTGARWSMTWQKRLATPRRFRDLRNACRSVREAAGVPAMRRGRSAIAMLSAIVVGATASTADAAPSSSAADVSRLSNGQVTVGVDLARGGAITELSSPGRPNVVNSFDLGREVQQSYYAGPSNLGNTQPPWSPWPWNPVAAGDRYGRASQVLEASNDGRTIYVKSRPKQWALDNVDCECTFEQWVSLDGPGVHVRNRLTNARSDRTQYQALHQELPAAYVNGTFTRLFTYDGPAPYTGDSVTERPSVNPPQPFSATEHWAAFVDGSGWGMGVVSPDLTRFFAGYCPCGGPPGQGGPGDPQEGYISPQTPEVLDADIAYEYSYDLVVGRVDEIRAYAVARRRDTRPDYRFSADRQHFTYINATDTGWPIRGTLRVKVDRRDPILMGPEQLWKAADVPRIYIQAAFHTRQNVAEVFWQTPGGGISPDRRMQFTIQPDGQFHTYVVNLAASPNYRGTISGLRFDPVVEGEPGGYVDVASISWREPSVPPALPPPPAADGGDRRPPRISLRVASRQRLTRRGLRVRMRCDEACRVHPTARLTLARRPALRATRRSLAAGRWTTVRFRASHRTLARVRSALRHRRRVRARLRFRAEDGAGNAAVVTRTIRIVRRR